MTTTNWLNRAACKGKTDLFFPQVGEATIAKYKRERTAKAICNACPVMYECRKWARENNELGYWGGESEEERWRGGFLINRDYEKREASRKRRAAATAAKRQARESAVQ